jgi:hypothetical protein
VSFPSPGQQYTPYKESPVSHRYPGSQGKSSLTSSPPRLDPTEWIAILRKVRHDGDDDHDDHDDEYDHVTLNGSDDGDDIVVVARLVMVLVMMMMLAPMQLDLTPSLLEHYTDRLRPALYNIITGFQQRFDDAVRKLERFCTRDILLQRGQRYGRVIIIIISSSSSIIISIIIVIIIIISENISTYISIMISIFFVVNTIIHSCISISSSCLIILLAHHLAF